MVPLARFRPAPPVRADSDLPRRRGAVAPDRSGASSCRGRPYPLPRRSGRYPLGDARTGVPPGKAPGAPSALKVSTIRGVPHFARVIAPGRVLRRRGTRGVHRQEFFSFRARATARCPSRGLRISSSWGRPRAPPLPPVGAGPPFPPRRGTAPGGYASAVAGFSSRSRPAAGGRSRDPPAAGRTDVAPMIPPQVHLRRPCYDFSFL